ncbi:MAG: hypothetical protein KKA81_16545 [Bacteroidetes bacterium]|nr:hypothetical protein [Bacteroidota bacterium]
MNEAQARSAYSSKLYWAGLGVLTGACVGMPGYLLHGPLAPSPHRVIGADNFTTWVLGWWTLAVVIANYKSRRRWVWADRQADFVATVLLLAALPAHRALWMPWRIMLELESRGIIQSGYAAHYRDTWAQFSTIPQGIWWVAFCLFAAPIYRKWYGASGWVWAALIFISATWVVGYQMPDFVRIVIGLWSGVSP